MTSHQYVPEAFLFGGDYNPEQWDPDTWREDIELMKRAGVNTVTLGVFSWARLEPREGEYETGWLDEVISLLDEAGIGFFLATPTASPPPWFTLAYPDAMPVRADGVRLTHGSRDTYAISAPAYRNACCRIAGMLARRYGVHRRLRGWHVHNEYGTLDFGPHAAAAFRSWLRNRYGTLDALNVAWCTSFWSQRYSDWEEIFPPVATQYLHNPALSIDFRRFSSDEMLAAFTEQKREIQRSSSAPVTTNFMLPTWNHLEQWSWAEEQDVVSIDHYLDSPGPDGDAHVAYGADLTRSWADGSWLLMEQNATGIFADGRTYTKTPSRMIRNSLGYIARGSQSSLFFQWRASVGGAEQWHGALVPHAGGESGAFATAERLGEILSSIAEAVEPPRDSLIVDAAVGIVWHADGWWALETPHLPNDAVTYADEVRATHRSFWRAGIPTDFVRPGGEVNRYRMLVVPCLYVTSDGVADWLREFAARGGTVIVTYLSGIADENLTIATGGYPGRLRELIGARAEEIHVPEPGEVVPLASGRTGSQWRERLVLEGAESTDEYSAGPLSGLPALTEHRLGEGRVVYVSTHLDQESRDRFLAEQSALAGLSETVPGAAERRVEAIRRRGRDADYVFLLHHGTDPVKFTGDGRDLLSAVNLADGLTLAAGDVAVVRVRGGEEVRVVP